MAQKYRIETRRLIGDIYTPVSLYMRLRDLYPQSALLESSDYNSSENSTTYIAIDPISSVAVQSQQAVIKMPDGSVSRTPCVDSAQIGAVIDNYMSLFDIDGEYGIYGYTAYDSVAYMEQIGVEQQRPEMNDAPDLYYILYRYTLVYDHHFNTLTLRELVAEGEQSRGEEIAAAIENRDYSTYDFTAVGDIYSTMSDEEYIDIVKRGVAHCMRGDVFQIVLSRRYLQKYKGDDFMVYRRLRSINPSPYLFYFDFGGFRIFGSSPETHCKVKSRVISIDPIAGTAFRTGDATEDARRAEALLQDPKESAEHVMLVDLARNDLSRNASQVGLEFYKQAQYYSHVIHLVSRVSGVLHPEAQPLKSYLDTFPAGTLSGSPKVRAMELINDYEPHNRGIYGGAIGYIGFGGDINQAITIRTFVSRNSTLEFQAGAGIVALSNPERELQEVKNKLGALANALSKDI
ncbi:MAG: anthranilate synthase component I family protein [Rikenellaceae bacterium]